MIRESELLRALKKFEQYRYGRNNVCYPEPIMGVSGLRINQEPFLTNCVAFIEGLIVPVATDQAWLFNWTMKRHRQSMLQNFKDDPFSPTTALVQSSIAIRLKTEESIPNWTIFQGWQRFKPTPRGHAFIVVRHDRQTDKILILEANNHWGLNGVGWRGIDNILRAGSTIPEDWVDRTNWTRQRLYDFYPHRGMAMLLTR